MTSKQKWIPQRDQESAFSPITPKHYGQNYNRKTQHKKNREKVRGQ